MADASLADIVQVLAGYVSALEPHRLTGPDAAELTALFARGERLCATGKSFAARRAVQCNQHERSGDRSGGEWLARLSGSGRTAAEDSLSSAEVMEASPELENACRSGELSAAQAGEIAKAAMADHSSTGRLVEKAKSSSLPALKEACKAVVLASRSREEDRDRLTRIHRGHFLRTWTDEDGAGHVSARLTPDRLARFKALLHPFAQRVYDEARRAGLREASECYAADGLLDMAEASVASSGVADSIACDSLASDSDGAPSSGDPASRAGGDPTSSDAGHDPATCAPAPLPARRAGAPATVVVLIDLAALRRGHALPEETCHIDGVGPVPVAAAKALMRDAFWTTVLKDGVDIRKVVHLGRDPTAAQRTALLVRDRTCVVPGCNVSKGLEIDHVRGWEATLHTTLDELARLCSHHHDLKTYQGWTLSGSPGQWQWLPPPGGPLPGPFDDDGLDIHPGKPPPRLEV